MTLIGYAPETAVGQTLSFPEGETPVTGIIYSMSAGEPRLVFATGEHETRVHDASFNINNVIIDEAIPYRDYFYKDDEDDNRGRFMGSVINPTPENGATYRCFDMQNTALTRGFLLRYNDDDHVDDRNTAPYAWSIIGGAFGPHHNDSDALVETPSLYVKVTVGIPTAEAEPTLEELLSPASEVTPDPEPEPVDPNIARFYGKGKLEEDGTLALNPTVTVGDQYMVHCASYSNMPYLAVATVAGEIPSFYCLGYFRDENAEMRRDPLTLERSYWAMDWVKADLTKPRPEPVVDEAQKATLDARLMELREQYTQFRHDVNALASRCDWCPEYETIVENYGMTGRHGVDPDIIGEPEEEEPETFDWRLEISAGVRWSNNSPASGIDDAFVEAMSDESTNVSSFSTTAVEGRADIDFTFRLSEVAEDDVEDMVDEDSLIEYFNNNTSEINIVEILNYRIMSTEKDE